MRWRPVVGSLPKAASRGLDEGGVTEDDADVERAPICPYCGVTCLAAETWGDLAFVCENADCEAFGDTLRAVVEDDHSTESRAIDP